MKKTEKAGTFFLVAKGLALLSLLAVCSFSAGRKDLPKSVTVPVMVEMTGSEIRSAQSVEQIREKLRTRREGEIRLLTSVAENPASGEEIIQNALKQKMEIALRMEEEARVEAALSYMGFDALAAVCGAESMTVFAPYAYVSSEADSVRILDCICTQTGFSPENVKIILAKNE